jgi:hypothetical protein
VPSLHAIQTHPEFVEDCFGCKASTLQLATGAGNESFSAKLDAKLELDRPAYKAMRKQGFQPPSVTGAHELMTRATTPAEIQMGRILPNADKVQNAVDNYRGETGKSLLDPMTTPKVLA